MNAALNAAQWSEVIRNYATVIGLFAGGAWAFWKWGYSDWAGAQKNRASLDGHLSAESVTLPNRHVLVTLQAQWNNRGQFPISIDPRTSQVLVYELSETLPLGEFDPSNSLGSPLFVQHPFKCLAAFELEPRTESALRAHFVLEQDKRYFFRWELRKAYDPKAKYTFIWSKELVWYSID